MKKAQIQFALPVSILRENDSFIAYTPALDLSTVGDTFEEAKKRFEEAVQIFFEEIMEKGTLEKVLTELGWHKQENTFAPPVLISYMTENFSIPISS
ncbi:hypothetical protein COT62_00910 [Candidatus Roizmanbacteria bacterium CG09_land_8_20_14_0_10_41_9]|uniref:Type II toxin-antitoxin system HicB family antitoxin n=1 Tax=Candidatus Roizmanbacteria bacterium CG09_land_8_20_14_0_10_41_9 TaxID=1974850 RepID=A0A2H0WTJ0_9BACT|nr:MAG: hypothetical protein COT62_00910 [Candidatus Roizmanbacteria bacterium CG09_land_8_20_14_0_10_41_9]